MKEEGKDVRSIQNRPVQDDVLGFLRDHKDMAYTQKEIADELGIVPQQARQCLHALLKKHSVARKGYDVVGKSGKTTTQIHWKLA